MVVVSNTATRTNRCRPFIGRDCTRIERAEALAGQAAARLHGGAAAVGVPPGAHLQTQEEDCMRATLLAIAAVAGFAGCASSRVQLTRLADARGEIRAAEQLDADRIPTAAGYLDLARKEEDQGRQLLNLGEATRAGYVLERAQADAELALALATEAPS